ncbi:MAG: class I SAM-dependent methyltransferase [Oscillochloridaceae bacterium]|nr:class I SAM-dependent methyltransferase [Chloroflexaceae bacterium]MDW8389270.1 class I SAM-dependent methyltransferase [Oscillochloridaceae bacterium]
MNLLDYGRLFDAHYFATGLGAPYRRDEHWMSFFAGIAERIVAEIGPASALDAGCAMGLLVEQLRLRGVAAEGVDISAYAIANAPEAVREHVRVASVVEPFGRSYDLIICIEVLEHLPRAEAERAVVNLCRHSDDVLFSSSPLDYKEATHFNVNPPEYWADLFARQGFFRDLDFDAAFITPWAARFRRRADPSHRIIRDYERHLWELRRENADLRRLALEQREQLAVAHERATEATRQLQRFEQSTGDLAAYAARLEAELARKNAHIAHLERLIERIENGRVLRLLRALTGARGGRRQG